ncbi:MAG: isoprenylcysteine carboxylmethyltransferase family protein [Desulfosalsimonadaceae bacterium]
MPDKFLNRINKLFNDPKIRKVLVNLRLPIGILLFLLLLTLLKPAWFFPGLLVSILGEALQIWCMATIKTKKSLTITGPYMFVRNPMYIGRYFLILGILMMTGSIWLMLIATAIYYFYMVNRVNREEKILLELFGEDYEQFRRDVPSYLPTFRRFDKNQLRSWNAESIKQNSVITNMIATGVCYIVLFLFTFVW